MDASASVTAAGTAGACVPWLACAAARGSTMGLPANNVLPPSGTVVAPPAASFASHEGRNIAARRSASSTDSRALANAAGTLEAASTEEAMSR